MSILENIKILFEKDYILSPMEDDGKWFFILEESDPSAKNFPKCKLLLKTSDALMIKLDSMFPPPNYFAEQGGKRTRCDYLLFLEEKNKVYILFVELKSKKFSHSKIEQKFMGGECFVDYCHSISSNFNNYSLINSTNEKRFVTIGLAEGNRRNMCPPSIHDGSNTSPDRFHYIQVESIENSSPTQELRIKELIGENRS